MINLLKTWVLNIVSIIIFITFLEILLPNSSIKKYIKMIVGLLVMIIILNPLLQLVNGEFQIENEILKTSSQINKVNLTTSLDYLEREQEQQIISYYKFNLENSIKERIEFNSNVKVLDITSLIEEDMNSNNFGDIKKLNLVVEKILKNKDCTPESSVVPTISISLGDDRKKQSIDNRTSKNDSLINEIKKNIAEIFSLNNDLIHIEVKENK